MPTPLRLTLELLRSRDPGEPFVTLGSTEGYMLRLGEGQYQPFELRWSELAGDLFAASLPGCPPELAARVGAALRSVLDPAGWTLIEEQLTLAARRGDPADLHIVSAASELYNVPWELLTLRSTGQALGQLHGCALRWSWPQLAPPDPAPGADPAQGKVLFAWSDAGGGVPEAEHRQALQAALGEALVELPQANTASLRAQLSGVNVLHLLCHGGRADGTLSLMLGDRTKPDLVSADELRSLLSPLARQLRLVVLSVCQGASAITPDSALGSLALAAHRAGCAVVIASRFALSSRDSVRFASTFYAALRAESSLPAALRKAEGREGLLLFGDPDIGDATPKALANTASPMPFVFVPGGPFTMGGSMPDELPQHTVTLSPFYVAKTPVLQSQWEEVMGNNPSRFVAPDHPVERVSWLDAVRFANELSDREGRPRVYLLHPDGKVEVRPEIPGYRLPTEAEWERFARAGSAGERWCERLEDCAWVASNSGESTHECGAKAPNSLGLFDVYGNVWEWTRDRYSPRTYDRGATRDPRGPETGAARVVRGGSFLSPPEDARSARRELRLPDFVWDDQGFRLVISAKEAL